MTCLQRRQQVPAVRHTPGSHNAKILAEYTTGILHEFGVTRDNTVYIVTDGNRTIRHPDYSAPGLFGIKVDYSATGLFGTKVDYSATGLFGARTILHVDHSLLEKN